MIPHNLKQQYIQRPHGVTLRLYERLAQLKLGEIVTWEELSSLIDLDARKEGNSFVCSARRMCRRQNGYCFITVVSVGVKRCTDEEIATEKMAFLRRKLRHVDKEIIMDGCCANTAKLSPEAHKNLMVHLSIASRNLLSTAVQNLEKEKEKVDLTQCLLVLPPFIVE